MTLPSSKGGSVHFIHSTSAFCGFRMKGGSPIQYKLGIIYVSITIVQATASCGSLLRLTASCGSLLRLTASCGSLLRLTASCGSLLRLTASCGSLLRLTASTRAQD